MITARSSTLWALVLPSILAAQPKPVVYKNDAHGIHLQLPRRFKQLPIEKDRRYVLAQFIAKRGHLAKGLPFLYRATIRVIRMPKGDAPKTGGKKPVEAKASKTEPLVYKDYQDYLQRNLPGGLALESNIPTKIGDRDGLEVLVSCNHQGHVYRLRAYLVDRGRFRYIVETMYMPIHKRKVEAGLLECLKSFRLTKPSKRAVSAAVPSPKWRADPKAWRKLSQGQRKRLRLAHERAVHEAARRELLPGWRVVETEAALLISDAPERYLGFASKGIVAARKLLEQRFGDLSDETVIRPVVRVFYDHVEYLYYRSRSNIESHYIPWVDEICAPAIALGRMSGYLEAVHDGLLHQFLNDKHEHLHRHLPAWLEEGFREYLRWSKVVEDGLLFIASDEEKVEQRNARRKKRRFTLRQIMNHDGGDLKEGARELRMHRGRLVRFVMQSEDKALGRFLSDYAKAVRMAQDKFYIEPLSPGAVTLGPELAEARSEYVEELRDKLLGAVNASALKWSDQRWAELQQAYEKFNSAF